MHLPRRLCFEDRTRRRTFDMYRIIIVLVCLATASSAPQDSNVTFVKIQPLVNEEIPDTTEPNTDVYPILNSQPLDTFLIPNITFENNELTRQNDTTEVEQTTTETVEITTEVEMTTLQTTTKYPKPKIKQSPRFLSKLSHFKNTNTINTSTNSINSFVPKVDRPYKRKFKSRCRCAKIENCPKLQITVPRCPNDYFLCCF